MAPEELPLSIEPVLGWRVWALQLDSGRYRLGSLISPTTWQPREALHATCPRGHVVPGDTCRCGIYAASSLRALVTSGALMHPASVVGAIAMWGRVVEHQRGVRGAAAYPARLRLVCGPCLRGHRGAVEPVAVVSEGAGRFAVCARHLREVHVGLDADAIQAELLESYGVEPLSMAKLSRELRYPLHAERLVRLLDERPRPLDIVLLLARISASIVVTATVGLAVLAFVAFLK